MLPRQRFALAAGRVLLGAGLARLLPDGHREEVDWPWWQRLLEERVTPVVGPIRHLALRVPSNPRHSALLMAADGRPLAFVKILGEETSSLAHRSLQLLGGRQRDGFRVPALLASGSLEGVPYQVVEPLPEGAHRPPPLDLERLWAVIDDVREGLASLPRPEDTPASYVAVHNDLTPRNLRVAHDGTWWLFDLDRVMLGPALVDELRLLCASFAYRRRPRVERDAWRILQLLRQRGTDEDVVVAVEWQGRPARTYRSVEDQLRLAVGRLAAHA